MVEVIRVLPGGGNGNGGILSAVEDQGFAGNERRRGKGASVFDELPVDRAEFFVGGGERESAFTLPFFHAACADEVDETAGEVKARAEEHHAIHFFRISGGPDAGEVAAHAGGADPPGAAGVFGVEAIEGIQGGCEGESLKGGSVQLREVKGLSPGLKDIPEMESLGGVLIGAETVKMSEAVR